MCHHAAGFNTCLIAVTLLGKDSLTKAYTGSQFPGPQSSMAGKVQWPECELAAQVAERDGC